MEASVHSNADTFTAYVSEETKNRYFVTFPVSHTGTPGCAHFRK